MLSWVLEQAQSYTDFSRKSKLDLSQQETKKKYPKSGYKKVLLTIPIYIYLSFLGELINIITNNIKFLVRFLQFFIVNKWFYFYHLTDFLRWIYYSPDFNKFKMYFLFKPIWQLLNKWVRMIFVNIITWFNHFTCLTKYIDLWINL